MCKEDGCEDQAGGYKYHFPFKRLFFWICIFDFSFNRIN